VTVHSVRGRPCRGGPDRPAWHTAEGTAGESRDPRDPFAGCHQMVACAPRQELAIRRILSSPRSPGIRNETLRDDPRWLLRRRNSARLSWIAVRAGNTPFNRGANESQWLESNEPRRSLGRRDRKRRGGPSFPALHALSLPSLTGWRLPELLLGSFETPRFRGVLPLDLQPL
jgi:hypothetical protein